MHWKILAAVGWVGLMSSIGHATPEEGARGPWALELVGAWLPDQPEQAFCNREADCLSQARTFVGGALRASWRGTWGAVAATAGVARAVDLEGRPAAFGVLALRIDAQFEVVSRDQAFGMALRVSPVLAVGWSDSGAAVRTDIPGLTVLLGSKRVWGEVGMPTLPSPFEARMFLLGAGAVWGRWSGSAGFGSFGTLGYAKERIDKASTSFGGYADVTFAVEDAWDVRLQLIMASPFQMSVGVRWWLGGERSEEQRPERDGE